LNEYRADSVKHATSPSRHGHPRQVVIPTSISNSAANAPKIKTVQCSYRFSQTARFALPTCFDFHALPGFLYVWSLSRQRVTKPRLTNFDTKPHSSYRYEVEPDNRLESLANAHTAADLHVRPVPLTALVSRAAGAANALRDTACLISRNENDSTLPRFKTRSARQTSQSISTALATF